MASKENEIYLKIAGISDRPEVTIMKSEVANSGKIYISNKIGRNLNIDRKIQKVFE